MAEIPRITRREFLIGAAASVAAIATGCKPNVPSSSSIETPKTTMATPVINHTEFFDETLDFDFANFAPGENAWMLINGLDPETLTQLGMAIPTPTPDPSLQIRPAQQGEALFLSFPREVTPQDLFSLDQNDGLVAPVIVRQDEIDKLNGQISLVVGGQTLVASLEGLQPTAAWGPSGESLLLYRAFDIATRAGSAALTVLDTTSGVAAVTTYASIGGIEDMIQGPATIPFYDQQSGNWTLISLNRSDSYLLTRSQLQARVNEQLASERATGQLRVEGFTQEQAEGERTIVYNNKLHINNTETWLGIRQAIETRTASAAQNPQPPNNWQRDEQWWDGPYCEKMQISDPRNLNILDVGPGEGHTTYYLQERFPGANVVGIEINPQSAQAASNRNPEATIVHGDFLETPIDIISGIFQVVNYNMPYPIPGDYMLHPNLDNLRIFQRMAEIIPPGGCSRILTEDPANAHWIQETWKLRGDGQVSLSQSGNFYIIEFVKNP